MTVAAPDPLLLDWPRRTPRAVLRPVLDDDAAAITRYRRRPEVVRFLTHGPLDQEAVARRIEQRMVGRDHAGRLVRGAVVEVDGEVVGDVMLRVQPVIEGDSYELWIGYAFSPETWGRGLATETVLELIEVARELGLPARADVEEANIASRRVLEKAGMSFIGTAERGGSRLRIYGLDMAG